MIPRYTELAAALQRGPAAMKMALRLFGVGQTHPKQSAHNIEGQLRA